MESAANQVLGLGVRAAHVVKQRQRNDEDVDSLKQNVSDLASIVTGLEASLDDHPEILSSLKAEIEVVNDYIQRYENPSLTKQGMKLLRPDQVSDTLTAHGEDLHQHITRVQLKLMGHLLPLLQESRQKNSDFMTQLMALTGSVDGINQTIVQLMEKMDRFDTDLSSKPSASGFFASDPAREITVLKDQLVRQEGVLDRLPAPAITLKAFSDGTAIKGNVTLSKMTQHVVGNESAPIELSAFSHGVTIEGDVDLGDFSQMITVSEKADDEEKTSVSGPSALSAPVSVLSDKASVKGNVGFKTLNQQGGNTLSAFSGQSVFGQNITGGSFEQSNRIVPSPTKPAK